jgi:hypothetical protein
MAKPEERKALESAKLAIAQADNSNGGEDKSSAEQTIVVLSTLRLARSFNLKNTPRFIDYAQKILDLTRLKDNAQDLLNRIDAFDRNTGAAALLRRTHKGGSVEGNVVYDEDKGASNDKRYTGKLATALSEIEVTILNYDSLRDLFGELQQELDTFASGLSSNKKASKVARAARTLSAPSSAASSRASSPSQSPVPPDVEVDGRRAAASSALPPPVAGNKLEKK